MTRWCEICTQKYRDAWVGAFKVTDKSSIEIFATNNEVMYISPRVHVSNKLARAKYSY